MRSGARLILCAMLSLGCGDDDGSTGGDGGAGPCVEGAPGVQVSVTVACTNLSPCTFTSPVVRINFPPNNLVEFGVSDGVHIDAFDEQNHAVFRLPYPSNAGTGAATAVFYADATAPYHIHGETSFDSYPTGCVMVDVAAADVQ